MCVPGGLKRVITRFLLKQPERVLAAILTALACGAGLALFLSPGVVHDQPWSGWAKRLDESRSPPADPDALPGRSLSLRASSADASVVGSSGAEQSAMLKALSSIEQRLDSVDTRLAASEHAASSATLAAAGGTQALAPAAAGDGQMQTQVAALSQTVAAVLSLVASDHQRAASDSAKSVHSAAPSPPPPPPPPAQNSWEQREQLENIKRDVEQQASDAAKAQIEPEITKLKKTLARLNNQGTNRYTQLLKDLAKLTPDTTTVPYEAWNSGGEDKTTLAPVLSKEQAAGHGCRSPPCSRDVESCKYNDNCCADRMYEMLSDFSDFLKAQNVTHMVVAGTLIGAVRDKDIIPYTSDVDLMIPREGWEKAKAINYLKGRKRSYFFMQDPHEQHCGRLCAVWEGLPVNRAAFTDHFDWDTDQIGSDIQYYMDIYDEQMDFAKQLAHLHYPVSNVTIRNKSFPAPHEQELWVEARYGSSWRTPDHKSHFGDNPYPTLDEAKHWSESMVMLRKARTDAVLGHRLLERATVDHKSGHILVKDSGEAVQLPDVEAKRVIIEGFLVSTEGKVTNGTVAIWPPDIHEGQITHYLLFWAAERVRGWDLTLEHVGGQIASVPRCLTGGDPFKACAGRGKKLHFPLSHSVKVPAEATHLVVVSANEAGSSTKSQSVALGDKLPGGSDAQFTRRATLGILGGLASESPVLASCVTGATAMMHEGDGSTTSTKYLPGVSTESTTASRMLLKSQLNERVVNLMLRKTPADMKAALRALAEFLDPVLSILQRCAHRQPAAEAAHASLERALARLSAPKDFKYVPGKTLDIDGTTIFLGINHAIGELRKDKPANFGMAVGEFLKPLGRDPAEFQTPEDKYYHSPGTEHMSAHSGLRTLSSSGTLSGPSTGVKYFVASVKAGEEARIALFREKVKAGVVPDNTSVLYEFVIGRSLTRNLRSDARIAKLLQDADTANVLRLPTILRLCAITFSRSGKNEVVALVENAPVAGKFLDFWVSADAETGRVALGRGQNISENVIVNMTDVPPGVRGSPVSFAVMTPSSLGAWRFPEADQGAGASTLASSTLASTSSEIAAGPSSSEADKDAGASTLASNTPPSTSSTNAAGPSSSEADQDAGASTLASNTPASTSSTNAAAPSSSEAPLILKAHSKRLLLKTQPAKQPEASSSLRPSVVYTTTTESPEPTESTSRQKLLKKPPRDPVESSASARLRKRLHMSSSPVGIGGVPPADPGN